MPTPRGCPGVAAGMQRRVPREDAGGGTLISAAVLFGYEKELEHEKRPRVKRNHLTRSSFSRKEDF